MVQTDRKLVPFSRHNHRCIFTKKGATCKIKTFVKDGVTKADIHLTTYLQKSNSVS